VGICAAVSVDALLARRKAGMQAEGDELS